MNNYWELFRATADRWADRPALVVQRQKSINRFDYRALAAQAESFAARLLRAGVASGDRCAILGENSPAWCAAYLGVLRVSASVVPLDRTYSAEQVQKLLSDSGASVVFASDACKPVAQAALDQLTPKPVLLDLAWECLDPSAPGLDAAPCLARRSDPAVVLYTSGTTADPKGVVLTHENLLTSVDGMVAMLPISERDCSLGALPLFHILSQISILLLPFAIGGCVVLLEEVNADQVLRAMRERGITVLCSVPQFFYLIHERISREIAARGAVQRAVIRLLLRVSGFARDRLHVNFGAVAFHTIHAMCGPRVRYFVSAGAAFDPQIARELHLFGFDILQAYGLTESTGAATVTPPHANRLGSVGLPIPGVSVEVRAPDGTRCERGREGEVVLRGAILTPGYYRRPDATAAAFRDGWFWTGDLGVFDSDGYLHITGRSKDVIILGSGKNVYPEEIERQLERSPLIKEVCVIGRRQAGRALSETLHAVVVPDMTALRERRIVNTREAVRRDIETLSARLQPYQKVTSFEIARQDLPRTTTRKIKRHLIRQQVEEPRGAAAVPAAARPWSEEDRAWARSPAVAAVLARVAAQAPAKPEAVHPGDSLELDLGFDSLGRVELIVALEQALGVKLAENASADCYTVRDLALAVQRAVPADGSQAIGAAAAWPTILDAPAGNGASPRAAGIALDLVRFVGLKLIRLLARLTGFTVTGLENLPAGGVFIVCINHQSYLDGFLLLCAMPYDLVRRLVLLGKPQYFEHGIVGLFSPRLNIASVDADANLVQAMRVSAQALRDGKALLLFPEGERSIDGEIKALRRGAAVLACHFDVAIVPVVIDGAYRIWPRGRGFQGLAPVSLRILPSIMPEPAGPGGDDTAFDRRTACLTETLRQRMTAALAELRAAPAPP